MGWAYKNVHDNAGSDWKTCNCKTDNTNNWAYITGYDTKCGHDMGWARTGIVKPVDPTALNNEIQTLKNDKITLSNQITNLNSTLTTRNNEN